MKQQFKKVENKIPEKYKKHLNHFEKAIVKEFHNIKGGLKEDSQGRRPYLPYVLAFAFFYYIFFMR